MECDGRELLAGEAWQVTVAASGAFGAGASVPEADPGDGALEVVAIEEPFLQAGRSSRSRTGCAAETLTDHPHAFHRHCSAAKVAQVPDTTKFNVDGEVVTAGDVASRPRRRRSGWWSAKTVRIRPPGLAVAVLVLLALAPAAQAQGGARRA